MQIQQRLEIQQAEMASRPGTNCSTVLGPKRNWAMSKMHESEEHTFLKIKHTTYYSTITVLIQMITAYHWQWFHNYLKSTFLENISVSLFKVAPPLTSDFRW